MPETIVSSLQFARACANAKLLGTSGHSLGPAARLLMRIRNLSLARTSFCDIILASSIVPTSSIRLDVSKLPPSLEFSRIERWEQSVVSWTKTFFSLQSVVVQLVQRHEITKTPSLFLCVVWRADISTEDDGLALFTSTNT
eukprot:CAMPEP_0196718238 /NCGR_PEP_ID=MMETSP1091-20130531/1499_1 /TAXON_ID=302021 /ORGANISM="Rhodomonas sp., Strain CCMP768" /LENGTH=140 /DNA_ID=CAMNT_0042058855 /DNA_START=181 /DNA_END=603 /DNA_ORIENTATION=-